MVPGRSSWASGLLVEGTKTLVLEPSMRARYRVEGGERAVRNRQRRCWMEAYINPSHRREILDEARLCAYNAQSRCTRTRAPRRRMPARTTTLPSSGQADPALLQARHVGLAESRVAVVGDPPRQFLLGQPEFEPAAQHRRAERTRAGAVPAPARRGRRRVPTPVGRRARPGVCHRVPLWRLPTRSGSPVQAGRRRGHTHRACASNAFPW